MTTAILDKDAQVHQLPLSQVFPSATNPRKSLDETKLAELVRSIETSGLTTPILVRPFGVDADGDRMYEVAAGHRRLAAVKKLGASTIPAIVREMTDEEFLEVQLVENLQREDIDPLDVADSYAGLLETLGTAAAIAARVGKTIEHVTRVLKLRTLIPSSRQALAEKLITVDHALLLCKLAAAEQERALRFALRPNATRKNKTEDLLASALKDLQAADTKQERHWSARYWEPQSVLHLKWFIEREIKLELKRASWDLSDRDLVKSAGACTECPKNTAHNTALFSDLAVSEAACTDAECFNAKREAFVQIQFDAVKAACKAAVKISWKRSDAAPRALHSGNEKYLAQTFKSGQWIEAKKGSCGFAKTGISVDFGEYDVKLRPGTQKLVCVAAGCKVHPKAWERPAKAAGPGNQNSAEAKAKREELEAAVKAENEIRAGLIKQAIPKVEKLSGEVLRRIVLRALPGWIDETERELFPGLEQGLKTLKVDSPEFARAAVCVLFTGEGDSPFLDEWNSPEKGRKEFIALLKLLGFDASSAWAKPATPNPVAAKKAAAKKKLPAKVAKKGAKR